MNGLVINSCISYFLIAYVYELMVFLILFKSFNIKCSKRKAYILSIFFSCFNSITTTISTFIISSGIIEETPQIMLLNKLLMIIGELLIIIFINLIINSKWYKYYWLSIILHSIMFLPFYLYSSFSYEYIDNYVYIIPVSLKSSFLYIVCLLTYLALGCILMIVCRYFILSKKVERVPHFSWVIIYLLWFIVLIITPKNYSNSNNISISTILLELPYNYLLVVILVISIIVILIISIIYFNLRLLKAKNLLLEEQNKLQYENYLILQQKDFQIHKLYHDIGNHITTIKILINNNESQEAKRYTDNLIEEYKDISRLYFCNNHIINAVLTQKINIFIQNNISYDIDLKIPEIMNIQDIDLMSIYSNLLDNAIEGCNRNKNFNNYITINTGTVGDYLSIKIINSKCNDKNAHNILTTWKSDKFLHGYGTKIIDNLVKRYNGQKEFDDNGNEFSAFIMLKYKP